MTTFDERERAFENLFAHDHDLAFQAQARRDRATGAWVATLLGKTGGDAEAFAEAVVATGIERGEGAVLAKLGSDLAAGGVAVSEAQLRARLSADLAQAVRDVRSA